MLLSRTLTTAGPFQGFLCTSRAPGALADGAFTTADRAESKHRLLPTRLFRRNQELSSKSKHRQTDTRREDGQPAAGSARSCRRCR